MTFGKLSFEESIALLDKLGVEYQQAYEFRGNLPDRHEVKLPFFDYLYLPFTDAEWVAIARQGGRHYIGGCCGQTSAIQDKINHWFRFSENGVRPDDLADVVEMLRRHDGAPSETPDEAVTLLTLRDDQVLGWEGIKDCPAIFDSLDPWQKLGILWLVVRDFRRDNPPTAFQRDMSPLDRAIATLSECCWALSAHRMFQGDAVSSQEQAMVTLTIAKLLPALTLLNQQISERGVSFEGWALIDLEKGEEAICSNGFGLCLYQDREEALRVMARWVGSDEYRKEDSDRTPVLDRIGLRRVGVSTKYTNVSNELPGLVVLGGVERVRREELDLVGE